MVPILTVTMLHPGNYIIIQMEWGSGLVKQDKKIQMGQKSTTVGHAFYVLRLK